VSVNVESGRVRRASTALAAAPAARLIRVDGQPGELQRWSLEPLSPVAGFAAAVGIERL
jgi:hypothetical protein